MWPQGMNIPLVPTLILSQHTVQAGGSILRPFFLQCFFSIFTYGNFLIASEFAALDFLLANVYCSDIRLAISNN
jgi:hypothetical protein